MTGITVREALGFPALREAILVAGEAGLDRVIRSVNIMEVPYIDRFVKESELLLTTTYPIREDPSVQDRLVPMLAGRGLAALAIKPVAPWLPEVPSIMAEQAEKLAFPLIQLPADASFNEIINPILTEILNRQAAVLMRNERVHRALTGIVLTGGSLVEIAQTVANLMQAPVSIHSSRLRLLAFRQQQAEGEGEGEGSLTHDAVRAFLENADNLGALLRGQKGPVTVTLDGAPFGAIVQPVSVAREVHGYVVVWLGDRPARDDHLYLVEQVATVVALEMTKLRAVTEVEKRFRYSFAEDLIQGKIASRAEALARGELYGWDLATGFVPLLVEIDDFSRLCLTRQEGRDVAEILRRVWDTVSSAVSLHAPASIPIDMNSRILVLYRSPERSGPRSCPDDAKGLATRIQQELAQSPEVTVSIGLGRYCEDVMGIRDGFEQAVQSLSVGRVVNGPGSVTSFDELGVYRILADKSNRTELERFARDLLGPLIEADRRTNSELLCTLDVVLRCNGNLRQAARELYVHYNTLRYRVARISEITTVDLASAEGRLSLQLALKILRMFDENRLRGRPRERPREG